jgi:hypothetical protein
VDRDVRAMEDGDLRIIVAVKACIECDHGRSTARDRIVKLSPRACSHGGVVQVAWSNAPSVDPGFLFACTQINQSAC